MSEIVVMEHRRQIADITRDIRIKTGQFLMDAIEIGRLLYEAKSMVEPGSWMQYVETELPFSQSWANNYMRLYKEYGGEQLSIFGNSQATAKLSPTQALELLALPAQEREEFMESHDVENMSTRELKQAIRERDEAIQAKQDAEEELTSAQVRADNQSKRADEAEQEVEQLREALTKAEESSSAASQKVDKLRARLNKAKENEKAAKEALEKAKENPEIPEEVMEQMRQQVAADAAKQATEDLQKQLDAANAAKDAADQAKADAEQKLEAAEKAVKLANPDLVVLQDTINRCLDEFKKAHKLLRKIEKENPENGAVIKTAFLGTVDQMRGMIADA